MCRGFRGAEIRSPPHDKAWISPVLATRSSPCDIVDIKNAHAEVRCPALPEIEIPLMSPRRPGFKQNTPRVFVQYGHADY